MKLRFHVLLLVFVAFGVGLLFLDEPKFGDDFTYWYHALNLHERGMDAWSEESFHQIRWPVWGVCWVLQDLFGPGLVSYYGTPFLYLTLGALAAFFVGWKISRRAGFAWACALAFLFHPLLDTLVSRPMPDVGEGVFGAFAVLAWWGLMHAETRGRMLLCGAAAGAAIFLGEENRLTGVFLIPLLGCLTLLFFPRKILRIGIVGGVFAVLLAAQMAFYHAQFGDWLHFLHANESAKGKKGTEAVALWILPFRFLDSLAKGSPLAPFYALFAACGLWFGWKKNGLFGRVVVAWFSLLYLAYACAPQQLWPYRPLLRDADRFLAALAIPFGAVAVMGLHGLLALAAQSRRSRSSHRGDDRSTASTLESDLSPNSRATSRKAKKAFDLDDFPGLIEMMLPVLKEAPNFLDGRKLVRAAAISRKKRRKNTGDTPAAGPSPGLAGEANVEKDPLAAMELAEKILATDPLSHPANMLLHDAAAKAGFPETAAYALETLAGANPKDRKILHQLGSYYLSIGEPERAVQIYDHIERLDPADLDAIKKRDDAAAAASLKQVASPQAKDNQHNEFPAPEQFFHRRPLATGLASFALLVALSGKPLGDRGFFTLSYVHEFRAYLRALPPGTRIFTHHQMKALARMIDDASVQRLQWEAKDKWILDRKPELEAVAARSDEFWYVRKLAFLQQGKDIGKAKYSAQPPLGSYLDTPERDWRLSRVLAKDDTPDILLYSRRRADTPPALVLAAGAPELSALLPPLPYEWKRTKGDKGPIERSWAVPAALRGKLVRIEIEAASDERDAIELKVAFVVAGKTQPEYSLRPFLFKDGGKDFVALPIPADADSCKFRLYFDKKADWVRVTNFRLIGDQPP